MIIGKNGFSNLTIFEVFNVKTQTSDRNVRFYKFEPNQEYIIYIHCLKYYNNEYGEYYYPKYIFFQVKNSQIKTITGEEGIIFHEGPMFGLVNSNIQKDFYILSDEVYPLEEIGFHLYYAKTNETIENNLEILTSLEFKKYDVLDDTSIHIRKGRVENIVILFLPSCTE